MGRSEGENTVDVVDHEQNWVSHLVKYVLLFPARYYVAIFMV